MYHIGQARHGPPDGKGIFDKTVGDLHQWNGRFASDTQEMRLATDLCSLARHSREVPDL